MARAYKNPLRDRFSAEFFKNIPKAPGVYFMRDGANKILYIGKAANLKNRVTSYRNAKPGKVGSNIIKMLDKVERINWELHPDEDLAWNRELLLIRAIVPPYNIENRWRENYFFIGLKGPSKGRIEFRLTAEDEDIEEGFDLHGCYPMRRKVKYGYAALLRLLFALASESERFQFPSKLARPSPCYNYSLKIENPKRWKLLLSTFLHGEPSKFLRALVDGLLKNSKIPAYVRPGLQRDLNSLKAFEEACILSRHLGGRPPGEQKFVTHRQLRRRLKESIVVEDISL